MWRSEIIVFSLIAQALSAHALFGFSVASTGKRMPFQDVAAETQSDKMITHHYEFMYNRYLESLKHERLRLLEGEHSSHHRILLCLPTNYDVEHMVTSTAPFADFPCAYASQSSLPYRGCPRKFPEGEPSPKVLLPDACKGTHTMLAEGSYFVPIVKW